MLRSFDAAEHFLYPLHLFNSYLTPFERLFREHIESLLSI